MIFYTYNHWKIPSVTSQTLVDYDPNLKYRQSFKSGNIVQDQPVVEKTSAHVR